MLHNIDNIETVYSNSQQKKWKRPTFCTTGYSGHGYVDPRFIDDDSKQQVKKYMIRGYSGHVPEARTVYGTPSIPSDLKQQESRMTQEELNERKINAKEETVIDSKGGFRQLSKNMDLRERYTIAIETLLDRDQTQNMLLKIVQAKLSERVNSYAEQKQHIRLLFEGFDYNGDGVLDEGEFRDCLEHTNIQFDDVQVLALFAHFDLDYTGEISWRDFAANAMVLNPKGGTAVLPKQITSTIKSCGW